MTTPKQARKIADIAFSKGAALSAETILDLARQVEELQAEQRAWAERFPQYVYRPQDDVVELKWNHK